MTFTTDYQGDMALDATDFHKDVQIRGDVVRHQKFATFQGSGTQVVIPTNMRRPCQ